MKAFIQYFCSFSPNDSPLRVMKNTFYFVYKASQDIQIFCIFLLPYFSLCRALLQNMIEDKF